MKSHQGKYLTPFQRKQLLKSLESEQRPEYRRRIEIMLRADLGQSQTQICAELKCTQETARYWISMARAGHAHCWNQQPLGRPKTVNEEYIERLKELVSNNPQEYGYSFKRWTAHWLKQHLAKEQGIEISTRHINRLLSDMGLSSRNKKQGNEKVAELQDNKKLSFTICNLPSSSSTVSEFPINFIKIGVHSDDRSPQGNENSSLPLYGSNALHSYSLTTSS